MLHIDTKSSKQQQGQSMVEYTVVVFFSVLLLLAPLYDPAKDYGRYKSLKGDESFKTFGYANPAIDAKYAHVPAKLNSIEVLRAVMQDNYRGYSYAVSLSDYPDHETLQQQQQVLTDVTDTLQNAIDVKAKAIALVSANLPPKLPAISLPSPSFP